jgi:hypothetical protein
MNRPTNKAISMLEPVDFAAIFEPETVLPSQSITTEWIPEQRLLLAILEEAIATAGRDAKSFNGELAKKQAREWIRARGPDNWLVTFDNCCRAADVDPSWLRAGIERRWRSKAPMFHPWFWRRGGRRRYLKMQEEADAD